MIRRKYAVTPIDQLAVLERPQSLGEEIANSVSHGVGLLLALAGFVILLVAML